MMRRNHASGGDGRRTPVTTLMDMMRHAPLPCMQQHMATCSCTPLKLIANTETGLTCVLCSFEFGVWRTSTGTSTSTVQYTVVQCSASALWTFDTAHWSVPCGRLGCLLVLP